MVKMLAARMLGSLASGELLCLRFVVVMLFISFVPQQGLRIQLEFDLANNTPRYVIYYFLKSYLFSGAIIISKKSASKP